jgi:hypothetical protein
MNNLEYAHVEAFVNDKINVNKALKHASHSLFTFDNDVDEDKKYRQIISIIAREGPCTEHVLGKIGKNRFGLNRFTVRRRIRKKGNLLNLEKEQFVAVTSSKDLPGNKKRITYGLTIKGLMASLYYIKFEDNYLVKDFYNYIFVLTGNKYHIADLAMIYIKYHTALLLMWYKMMGLDLTSQIYLERILSRSMTKTALHSNYPISEIDQGDSSYFYSIGEKFYALTFVLTGLIHKIMRSKDLPIYSNPNIMSMFNSSSQKETRKKLSNFLEKLIIVDWANYLEMAINHPLDSKKPFYFDYGPSYYERGSLWYDHEIEKTVKEIVEKINVKKIGRVDIGHLL